jgi:F0F1-type ATP synthase assembly protein I
VSETPDPRARFAGDVLSFGWVLPASLAAGAGLGWLADKLFGTFPVLTIALALLGAAGGFRQVYRESTRLADDVRKGDERGRPPE